MVTASVPHAAGGQPLCALERAEKRYGRRDPPALGPVTLEVRPGEILGIRGPNGAGKSTLLALMAGSLRPDRGTCVRSPQAEGRIGYVPQDLSLYHTLTGLDNLKFWGIANGMPRKAIAARSRWLLERLDLSDRGKDLVSAYSGGMQRRLHLATALMVTPRLLLLDEPTVGADEHSAGLILSMLKHLQGMGCAVVLISHSPGELERVCSRILTLKGGLIAKEETRS